MEATLRSRIIGLGLTAQTLLIGIPAQSGSTFVPPKSPPYLRADGSVDVDIAATTARIADCEMTRWASQVANATVALDTASDTLDIFLAQIAAYRDQPSSATVTADSTAIAPMIDGVDRQSSPKGLQYVAHTGRTALATLQRTDQLLAYANAHLSQRSMPAFKEQIVLAESELTSYLDTLRDEWEARLRYRSDLTRRGVTLEHVFYEQCTGSGFWKVISATQTAGGEAIVMGEGSGVSTSCEGLGAADASAYLAMMKEDFIGEDEDDAACGAAALVADTKDKIEVRRECRTSNGAVTRLQSAVGMSDNKVSIQNRSQFSATDINILEFVYQRCDE